MAKRTNKMMILWNKTDISTALNISIEQLNKYLSEKVLKSVDWKKGQMRFRDAQVLEMLNDLLPAMSESERREIIGY